ncbi:MAG: hypothetical protein U9R66_08975 [Thermodesulfobacteriota bacterium]|nr:hypothetical protein [Thermodesulfobacteriota bacterium]
MVTFRYLHSKSKQYQTKTVTGDVSLPVAAQCPAKSLSQKPVLRLSPSMQQKTYHVSADGSACKSIQDGKKIKIKERTKIICPACKATMEIILTRIPKQPARIGQMFHLIRQGESMM